MAQETPSRTDNEAFRAALAAEFEVKLQIDMNDYKTGELATQQRQAIAEGDHARAAQLEEEIKELGQLRKILCRGGASG